MVENVEDKSDDAAMYSYERHWFNRDGEQWDCYCTPRRDAPFQQKARITTPNLALIPGNNDSRFYLICHLDCM